MPAAARTIVALRRIAHELDAVKYAEPDPFAMGVIAGVEDSIDLALDRLEVEELAP